MKAWHFVGDKLRDGSPVPADGVKLIHRGNVVPCESGLHASVEPFDALQYAPGGTLCLVECGGTIVEHGSPVDKIACSERTIIVRFDAGPLLWHFARQQALSVVHLWEPKDVVIDYLITGDECLRSSALDAAWDPAWSSARDAAWSAAWSAALSAALDAADAARSSARSAARDAAWTAAWHAARFAARSAGDAAWDAADASWDAADAAWDAAWDAARSDFNSLVYESFEDWL